MKIIRIITKIIRIIGHWLYNRIWIPFIKNIDFQLLITLTITAIGGYIAIKIPDIVEYFRCKRKPYITFESNYTQVFHLSKEVPSLEYSIGGESWKELKTQRIVFGGDCGKLLLRGRSTTGTNGATVSFGTDAEVVCTGNICTIVDYKNYKNTTASNAKFIELFNNCKQLTVPPELPIKILADSCYFGMFKNCTMLKIPPELPADSLNNNCYSYMFMGCTSIKEAPELPAIELADSCYYSMFENCSSLIKAPSLNAENLTNSCYSRMFKGCSSLVNAPKLPAKNLAARCYSYMFSDCTSITIEPDLPATKMTEECYLRMFNNCTSLYVTSCLPAMELAKGCYNCMFVGCTSLVTAPVLPAVELAPSCYRNMFHYCSSLSSITVAAIDFTKEQNPWWWLSRTSKKGICFKIKQAKWDEILIPSGWTIKTIEPEQIISKIAKQQIQQMVDHKMKNDSVYYPDH